MKKPKIPVKKKRSAKEINEKYNFEKSFRPGKTLKIVLYSVIIVLPVLLALNYIRTSFNQNNFLSFPLDDPWIHLTFAKNLAQYFSFSYFKNEMVTAGSTSPLYTILVSAMFLITNNEMMISYFLGIGFFAAACFYFYRLSVFEFDKEILFALFCTAVIVIDKWINFIADSGMETTMYIFILVLCSYFYKTRKAIPFAVLLGLVMWARPDGVAFIFAVAVDYLLVKIYSKDRISSNLFSDKDLKKISVIFIGIIGLYFFMNYMLSGSLLPNTYNAKLTYYSPEFRSRWDFIKYEVWDYFKAGSYSVLMIGFIFSVIKLLYDFYKKSYNRNTIYILFIFTLVLIYFLKLPYAHRFGRYMMPLIPFFILVATSGFRDLGRTIYKYSNNELLAKGTLYLLFGITFFIGIKNYGETGDIYSEQCKYIYDRQVNAALWIKNNTKEDDVIATHDVGAIGYYSNRKIVDVAGLVTPELIGKINDINYVDFMTKYLKDKGVTYLAFLREWYRVSNQTPLFTTANNLPPETMDIYKFNPERTHILSREANGLIMNAESMIQQKSAQQALLILNRVMQLDPDISYAYYLRAVANSILKQDPEFEKNMLKAVQLYPDFKDAHLNLGLFYKGKQRLDESKVHLSKVLELEPANVQAKNILKQVDDALPKVPGLLQ
ncbi:MAG: hypothetical protein ABI792_07830 [bacterium]